MLFGSDHMFLLTHNEHKEHLTFSLQKGNMHPGPTKKINLNPVQIWPLYFFVSHFLPLISSPILHQNLCRRLTCEISTCECKCNYNHKLVHRHWQRNINVESAVLLEILMNIVRWKSAKNCEKAHKYKKGKVAFLCMLITCRFFLSYKSPCRPPGA